MIKNCFSIKKTTVYLLILAILSPILSIGVNAQSKDKNKKLTEDQKIIHILNRLGFGARPGDVEKVKSIGIKKYIEQQLNPNSINDTIAESKLRNFEVLKLSNDELFSKYPAPASLMQIVVQQNGMTRQEPQAERAEMREERKNNQNNSMNDNKSQTSNEQMMYQQQVQEMYRKYNLGRPQQISQELNASRIIRAVYSEKQLQEVMVDFWTNHFNVFVNKQAVRWFLPEYDRDVIRPNALGKFRDLLLATAQSPAMLYYLDNFQSVAPNQPNANQTSRNQLNPQQIERLMKNPQVRERIKQQRGITDAQLDQLIKQSQTANTRQQAQQRNQRGINENYAREIMELHTLGVDGGYTQKDIQEVARAFTGWTITDPRGYRNAVNIIGVKDDRMARQNRQMGFPENIESGKFVFVERVHDKGEKIVLGQKINESGINDGLKVIDILAKHPSTAKFIAKKLAIKFVSDNPSEAFVNRIANAFTKSDGDIKQTLRVMFNDEEFYAPENYRAKIKTPFEVVISGIRSISAETNGLAIQQSLVKMGEQLYNWQAPTGYPDTAEDWVNTGALLERMNFAVALASNRIPGTRVDLSKLGVNSNDKTKLLDGFIEVILNGEISASTKESLLKQIEQPLSESEIAAANNAMRRQNSQQGQNERILPPSGNPELFKVVGIILGSPDFQRQ